MITLRGIDIDNFHAVSDLSVSEEQKDLVGSADWIMALAYALRNNNASALAVYSDDTPVGIVLTNDNLHQEMPGYYYISQFFIDASYQRLDCRR